MTVGELPSILNQLKQPTTYEERKMKKTNYKRLVEIMWDQVLEEMGDPRILTVQNKTEIQGNVEMAQRFLELKKEVGKVLPGLLEREN